jgi:hypothetical protein
MVKVEGLPVPWPLAQVETAAAGEDYASAPEPGAFIVLHMEGVEPAVQAKRALQALLERAHEDPAFGFLLTGTLGYFLATEAYAAVSGEPLADVRRKFACNVTKSPSKEKRLIQEAETEDAIPS